MPVMSHKEDRKSWDDVFHSKHKCKQNIWQVVLL